MRRILDKNRTKDLAILSSLFVSQKQSFIEMKNIKYSSVVWQKREHFVAQCTNVDISSLRDSRKEALMNLEEALRLYFE
jgi:hypothetical protein